MNHIAGCLCLKKTKQKKLGNENIRDEGSLNNQVSGCIFPEKIWKLSGKRTWWSSLEVLQLY